MADKKIKVGVIGVGRGISMIEYCEMDKTIDLVAICDKWEEGLENAKNYVRYLQVVQNAEVNGIAYYTDYDEFLKHDMDLVILANYAIEHAPFAVKALRAGKNVVSEVLPCQNLKEAVELIEAVEETGLQYFYAENYCYMAAPYEMKRLYKEGKLGELEYAEGEYIHDGESLTPSLTYGDPKHWRNTIHSFFYCTHSIGPIVHATGLRPVKVVGFETPYSVRNYRSGRRRGISAMEVLTMDNGAIVRSTHGGLKHNCIWFSMQGSKGAMETERSIQENSREASHLFCSLFEKDAPNLEPVYSSYDPQDELEESARASGHGGSDFRCLWNIMEKLKGNENADVIDVYEALDMSLPGIFAHFSWVCGGREQEIPDLRNKSERDKWRNDTRCTDPNAAGDMLLPTMPGGTPEIPIEIYNKIKTKFEEDWEKFREKCRHDVETGWAEDLARKAAEEAAKAADAEK